MADKEAVMEIGEKFVDAANFEVSYDDFDEFRKGAHDVLKQLYENRNDFLGSSSDKKFADFLRKNWSSIKKSGKMSPVELHGLIVKLMKGLPWGGLASFFTGSILKNLKGGFSKLASKASEFVKEFKNHAKNVAKRKKILDKLVGNVGKYLDTAKGAKEIEDVRDQIVDFVSDVRRICKDRFSECIDDEDKKVWEGLGTWANDAKVVDSTSGEELVTLLEKCEKVIGNNHEFVDGSKVDLVIKNLKGLIESGKK